jgi:threonine dehydrogenase-like Zn-dependent dehydrogenase
MKVMVFADYNDMRIQERPYPDLIAGEVIVKVQATGICGSDLHGYLGHDKTRSPGMILGHELSGTVVASTVERFPEGVLVTSNSAMTCGHCDYCVEGRDNLCLSRRSLGKHRQGGFAEYLSIPASALVEVPQDMDPVVAALTEPLANGVHAIQLARQTMLRPLADARTLVIGGGAIGFLATLLLNAYGCRDLTLAEVNAPRRAIAEAHIGCQTCDPRTRRPEDGSFDFVLDAVGSRETVALAIAALARGGTLGGVGLQDHSVSLDIQKFVRSQIAFVGVANYPTTALRSSVKMLHSGALGDLSWIETRPFEDGPNAFAELAGGGVASPKIVLLPGLPA